MANISLFDMGNTKKRTTREAVISLLSKNFPLNARKIFNRLKKEYHLNITYQAVFKLIKEMTEDGMLQKSDREYVINMKWISDLENELKTLKMNYLGDSNLPANQIQEEINHFVSEIGPKIKGYIANDSAVIVGMTGMGLQYAMNLWKYLLREDKNVLFIKIDKNDLIRGDPIKFDKTNFDNKKVVIADYAIFTGNTYKMITSKFNRLKNKLGIKDIKTAVNIDNLGLADFSLN